jgi:hypothetical protein
MNSQCLLDNISHHETDKVITSFQKYLEHQYKFFQSIKPISKTNGKNKPHIY